LPYPAGYGRPSPGGGAFSPCLTAAGLRFLDHPYPAEGLASPCGSVTGDALQTSSGFPRSALASYDRGGRPLYSGAVVSLYGTCLRAAPSRQGMSAPRAYGPTRRLRYPSFRRSKDHGASSRIHSRSPIRSFPHPVHPMGGLLLRACPQTLHAQKVLFPNQQGHNRWFPGYREDAHTAIVPSRAFGDCARASSARRATAGGRRIASFLATTDLVVDQKVRWKGRGFVDTLLGFSLMLHTPQLPATRVRDGNRRSDTRLTAYPESRWAWRSLR